MKNRAKLTDSVVEKLKLDTETFIYDEALPGLAIRVQPGGAKTWTVYKRILDKPVKKALGKFPVMNTVMARKAALEFMRAAEADQLEDKPTRKTCDEVMQAYLESYAKNDTSENNYKNASQGWAKHGTELKSKLIIHVTHQDVQGWVHDLAEDSESVACRRLNDFRAAVRWAMKTRFIELKHDPTEHVTATEPEGRNRCLSREEWDSLRSVLDANPGDVSDIILLLFATGARKGNVLSMEWKELNIAAGTWRIPKHKTKQRKEVVVGLTDLALEVLERRRFITRGVGYVFPSDDSDSGHRTQIQEVWAELRAKAGLFNEDDSLNFHLHDIRHTVATWLSEDDCNAFVIQKALQHANVSTSQKYTHPELVSVTSALNRIQKRA